MIDNIVNLVGKVSTLAQGFTKGTYPYWGISGIALTSNGKIVFSDTLNYAIKEVSSTGQIR